MSNIFFQLVDTVKFIEKFSIFIDISNAITEISHTMVKRNTIKTKQCLFSIEKWDQ